MLPPDKIISLSWEHAVRADPGPAQIPCRDQHHIAVKAAKELPVKLRFHEIVKYAALVAMGTSRMLVIL